jgi:hypothetical protein
VSLTSDQRQQVRYVMRRYLERAEANKKDIHYSQMRPITAIGDSPDSEFTADCSGYVICAYYWADIWSPPVVKDPGGYGYSGWGYTGSILETNKSRRVPLDRKFFVGDMALYGSSFGNTKHVTICRQNGDTMSSIWSSLGSESGPVPTRLMYRSDLLLVVRSEALA